MNAKDYKVCKKLVGGLTHYYAVFHDGHAKQVIEVSRVVCLELMRSNRLDKKLKVWDERHRDYTDFETSLLNLHTSDTYEMPETFLVDQEAKQKYAVYINHLQDALGKLTEIQRHRISLYFMEGLTFREIADKEGCSVQSVSRSIYGSL